MTSQRPLSPPRQFKRALKKKNYFMDAFKTSEVYLQTICLVLHVVLLSWALRILKKKEKFIFKYLLLLPKF